MTWLLISQLIIILLSSGVTTTTAAGGCAIPGEVLSDVVCGNGNCDVKTSGPGEPFSENEPYSPCCCEQDCPGVKCKFECIDPISGKPSLPFTCGDGSCVKTAPIQNYIWMDEDNPNGPCCCEKDCAAVKCMGKSTTTTAGSTTTTTTPSSTTTTTTPSTSTTSGATTSTTTPNPANDPIKDIIKRVNEVVCAFLNILFYISSAIFAMMLILAGFKHLSSDDPVQVANSKKMTVYALIGLILVVIACPLVDYLIAGSDILPFTKSCNCLVGSGGNPTPTTTTTAPVKCVDGTPHGQCSTTTAYKGYRCVGSYTAPVLQLDTSCGGTSTTAGGTTTTVVTTTSSSTSTTMCGAKLTCYTAETGPAGNTCGGLNLVCGTGTMEDCCNNYNCCCQPTKAGCTYP